MSPEARAAGTPRVSISRPFREATSAARSARRGYAVSYTYWPPFESSLLHAGPPPMGPTIGKAILREVNSRVPGRTNYMSPGYGGDQRTDLRFQRIDDHEDHLCDAPDERSQHSPFSLIHGFPFPLPRIRALAARRIHVPMCTALRRCFWVGSVATNGPVIELYHGLANRSSALGAA